MHLKQAYDFLPSPERPPFSEYFDELMLLRLSARSQADEVVPAVILIW